MKILLDECLPLDFRHSFPGHEAHTVQWAGYSVVKSTFDIGIAHSMMIDSARQGSITPFA